MPRTADHIAAVHRIARARVKAGKPVWAEEVDLSAVFRNDTLAFVDWRDAVVQELKATRWYRNADPHDLDGVREIIEYHLAHAEDREEFDGWWDELYDHADYDRVWITTR